jgi:hypothetical protein
MKIEAKNYMNKNITDLPSLSTKSNFLEVLLPVNRNQTIDSDKEIRNIRYERRDNRKKSFSEMNSTTSRSE